MTETADLAILVGAFGVKMNREPSFWLAPHLFRLQRDLQAVADAGQELPEETLKASRDFLGVLVGR